MHKQFLTKHFGCWHPGGINNMDISKCAVILKKMENNSTE